MRSTTPAMPEHDLLGVGAGPTNLSLAALIETARKRGLLNWRATFLERNDAVRWHSGQMFPGSLMQTEFYRDLVTPIDPTSNFSFLNFLKAHARLDQFFCSEYICPTRQEFEDYFNWVARQLPDVLFGTNVSLVDYDPGKNAFVIEAETEGAGERYVSKHVVLGCGAEPDSAIARGEGSRVVHVSELLTFKFPEPLRSILVVGSGQSAAECINFLLDRFAGVSIEIVWLTHETAFRALDKGNFSREAYSQSYGAAFAQLPADLRAKTIREESDAAYGITPEFALSLYQRLYALKHLKSKSGSEPSVHMQPNVEVLDVRDQKEDALVTTKDRASQQANTRSFGCVILCTGFEDQSVLDSALVGPQLKSRVSNKDDRNGYAVAWDGPEDRMIFVQSQNKTTHGLGDPNFITASGRNAQIINSIARKEIYRIDSQDRLVTLRFRDHQNHS